MVVPGTNLLALASTVIAFQTVDYQAFAGRAVNAVGKYVNTWADAVPMRGSFQSVDRRMYQNLGLDFNKSYRNFYSTGQVLDVDRGRGPDRISYFGRLYEAIGDTDWQAQDGWQGTLFVDITEPAP